MKRSLILLLSLICFIACVPTPQKEIVINKNDNDYEESIFTTASPKSTLSDCSKSTDDQILQNQIIETRWSDSIETEYLSVPIDAEIVIENQDVFPVRKVKKATISSEQIQTIAEAILPSVISMWNCTEISHEEYQRALLVAAENDQESGFLQSINTHISDQNAPRESFIETNRISIPDGIINQTYLCENGNYATIDKYNEYSLLICTVQHSNVLPESLLKDEGTYLDEGPVYPVVKQSQGDAESIAYSFLETVGLTGYRICSAEKARYYSVVSRDVIEDGWLFSFCHSFEYYPVDIGLYDSCGLFHMEEGTFYYAPWQAETLNIFVSENGVEYLSWLNPIEVAEIVNDNAQLMDFRKLQNEISHFLKLGLSYLSIDKRHYDPNTSLTKMILSYSLQPVKDEPDYGYLIPTWVCLFDYRFIGNDSVEFTSILLFNALNGAPITISRYPHT